MTLEARISLVKVCLSPAGSIETSAPMIRIKHDLYVIVYQRCRQGPCFLGPQQRLELLVFDGFVSFESNPRDPRILSDVDIDCRFRPADSHIAEEMRCIESLDRIVEIFR